MFNLNEFKKGASNHNRYERRLHKLVQKGQDVSRIKVVIDSALQNIEKGHKSFVIYGEPQSGKTEMMIALTSKLLDVGFKIIIVLLNDSVQLLDQNLERFQRSGLSPSPKKFSEILSPEVKIGSHQWVIFCKKNAKDLQKLIDKLDGHESRVVIDDEADYATPNSKINQNTQSKINELTGSLIEGEGIYIGVTATPARLDLNRTHSNENEYWVDFPPHQYYTGQDVFFPLSLSNLPYTLSLLPNSGDFPKFLREALFKFIVNSAYLNTIVNDPEENYSLLIHTSGKKSDHTGDYKVVVRTFEALRDENNSNHNTYYERLWEIAKERYPEDVETVMRYIVNNNDRSNIVVMNSDKEVNAADNRTATDPTTPFTVIIGGNIVSRGVTFNNLLSMFFTRDVKHKLQQDTYIQRARMFGARGTYLEYFELTIPKDLFLDWQKCFIFHRLSLESRKQDKRLPVWLDGTRVTAVSSSSIDRTNVMVDRGEMSFALFEYNENEVLDIIEKDSTSLERLKQLSTYLGKACLPSYLITYIESFMPTGDNSLAIHLPASIKGYTDKEGEVDKATITRTKGFIGNSEMELTKYPDAIHHIKILTNEIGKARVFYRYRGNVRFLKIGRR